MAEHLVRRAKHAVEQVELVLQQLQHALISRIALVQEVDDHYIEPLAVAVATANALLHTLGVPGQVVVDDERTELQVHALGRSFGGDKDF